MTESPVPLMVGMFTFEPELKHCVFVSASMMRIYVNDGIISLRRTFNLHGRGVDKMEWINVNVHLIMVMLIRVYLNIYVKMM